MRVKLWLEAERQLHCVYCWLDYVLFESSSLLRCHCFLHNIYSERFNYK